MGARGPNSRPIEQQPRLGDDVPHYTGPYFWDLLWGPSPDDPAPPSLEELEKAWKIGGARKAFMHPDFSFQRAGWRPWAFWQFDVNAAQKRKAEAAGVRCEAEAIIELGLLRRGERSTIMAHGKAIIKEQLENPMGGNGIFRDDHLRDRRGRRSTINRYKNRILSLQK